MNSKSIHKYIFLSFIFIIFFHTSNVDASSTDGTINSTNNKAILLKDGSIINAGYFTTQNSYNVSITDTRISGFMWGENIGWILLNCINTGSGCSSVNQNFKVSNDGYGNLSGYAWGENAGWINFGPFSDTSISKVKIFADGKFGGTLGNAGYAWSQNMGWIKFDCSSADSCTETDWRPINYRPKCNNTLDDDGDNLADFPNDKGCLSLDDNDEAGPFGVPIIFIQSIQNMLQNAQDYLEYDTNTVSAFDTEKSNDSTKPKLNKIDNIKIRENLNQSNQEEKQGGNNFEKINLKNNNFIIDTGSKIQKTDAHTPSEKYLLENIVSSKINKITQQIITLTGLASGFGLLLRTQIFSSPISFSEIILIPLRLWSLFLGAFGLRKKMRRWGVVYDSITKQPLDPVYVVLKDLNGKEIKSSITDLDGRYGFLVDPGVYSIQTNKNNYVFPSSKLSKSTSDELYDNIYLGNYFEIKDKGEVITKNIPMDPIKFDWNEFEKEKKKIMRSYKRHYVVLARVSNIFFVSGFLLATLALFIAPKPYNISIFVLYVLIIVLRKTGFKTKKHGTITERVTGEPLSFGILRLFKTGVNVEVAHSVTDITGRFYCLVENGIYKLKIEKKNTDGTYQEIYSREYLEVKDGVLNTDLVV